MKRIITILTIDSVAGLTVGLLTLSLSWLLIGPIFQWPAGYVFFIGGANVLYGLGSGLLLLSLRKTGHLFLPGLIILVIANSMWAGQCFAQIWWLLKGSPPMLMLLHMGLEAIFVTILAFFEVKFVAQFHSEKV